MLCGLEAEILTTDRRQQLLSDHIEGGRTLVSVKLTHFLPIIFCSTRRNKYLVLGAVKHTCAADCTNPTNLFDSAKVDSHVLACSFSERPPSQPAAAAYHCELRLKLI
jgi:hypothetical protein